MNENYETQEEYFGNPLDWGKSKRSLQESCKYCSHVDFETGDPDDRNKLLDKDPILQSTLVNGNELLQLEYNIGYFRVKARSQINYCPMCGRKLED